MTDRVERKHTLFFESNLIADKDIGTVKALQQNHAYILVVYMISQVKYAQGQYPKATLYFVWLSICTKIWRRKKEKMPESTFDEIVDQYVEMNVAHPFMEGNARSIRMWLDLIFKKNLGFCVDWSKINKNDFLNAMIESHIDSGKIKELLKGALTDKINDPEMFIKGIEYYYYYEEE